MIQSPYFVLSENAQNLLKDLKESHPDVKMIVSTNSLAATDNWATYAAHYGEKRIYLEDLELEMWEFKPIPEAIEKMMSYRKLLRRLPLPGETFRHGKVKFKIDRTLTPIEGGGQATAFPLKSGGERVNPHLEVPPYLRCTQSLWLSTDVVFAGSITWIPVRTPTTPK